MDLNYIHMGNQTAITEFALLGLSNDPQIQKFLFFIFLIIYTTTLLGNSLIIMVIRTQPGFHNPMFFFLSHLAFTDICYSSVTVPKMLENFTARQKTISRLGCITQIFFFTVFCCVDIFLLLAMAYDRYVAICDPLHYSTVMKKQMCKLLVGGAWLMAILDASLNTFPLTDLTFCRKSSINHCTCEQPEFLSLSCSDSFPSYTVRLVSTFCFGFIPFLSMIISYIYIISSILKIRSAKGRSKAFSTCSSHLIVSSMFFLSAFFRYLKPSSSLTELDTVISIQYNILTPMLNPIIYSLKNQEIKSIIWKSFGKCR